MKYSYLFIDNDTSCHYSLEYPRYIDILNSNIDKYYRLNGLPYLELGISPNGSKQYFISAQLDENLGYEIVIPFELNQSQLVDWIKQQKYRVRLKQLGDI